jgi:carbamoyltransferase
MRILGLSDGPRPAAVLVDGSELAAVAFADPRRYESPDTLVSAALERAGCSVAQVNRVVYGSHMGTRAPRPGRRGRLGMLREVVLKESGLWTLAANRRRADVTDHLRASGYTGDARSIDHFLALAEAAWRTQGRERALVLTAASGGDGTSMSVMVGSHDGLELLYRQGGLSSLSDYRGLLTHRVTPPHFAHRDPLPWLCDDDEPPRDLVTLLRRQLHFGGGGFNLAVAPNPRRFERAVQRWRLEDVAAAWQANLEHQFRRLVLYWMKETGLRHVVVGGEAFANPRLTRSLAELEDLESLHVLPLYGEPAVALGAALRFADLGPLSAPPRYRGGDLEPADCEAALQRAGASFTRPVDPTAAVVSLLGCGAAVGWAVGREAWSLDPLGHRCVLCSPADPAVVAHAARQLGQDPRVPPTSLVLATEANRHFPGLDRIRSATRYASVVVEPLTSFRTRCRGALALDGSARPLTVTADEPTGLHRLLSAFGAATGVPSLAALDLCAAGAPAPRSAAEVIDVARRARLDALVLGPYLVTALQ